MIMEKEILETVLTELLEEQKVTSQLLRELIEQGKVTQEKVAAFGQKMETLKIIAPPASTVGIKNVVHEGLMAVAKMVESQPKNVVRQFRFLLFPETNTAYYYKLVFGRLLGYGGLFVIAAFLIQLGKYLL